MKRPPVLSKAIPWLAGSCVLGLGMLLWRPALGVPFLLLAAFLAFFFRDPQRRTEAPPDAVLSPADGRVVEIGEVHEDRFLHQPAWQVSIFLSLWDVHLNRSPASGRVAYLKYEKGQFHAAFASRASKENERNYIGIEATSRKLLVVQIAGVLARRIECWVNKGDALQPGQRIGMIRFGSRTELFLPRDAVEVLVRRGDRVRAGETIVARWSR